MNCQESRKLLHAYLDNSVSPEGKQALERHLATCSNCRNELKVMRGIIEAIETEPLVKPNADFTNQVMACLPAPKRMFSLRGIFWALGIFLTVAAAAIWVWVNVIPIFEKQITVFERSLGWLLLDLLNRAFGLAEELVDFLTTLISSETFEQLLLVSLGLLVSFTIYHLVSFIYDSPQYSSLFRRWLF